MHIGCAGRRFLYRAAVIDGNKENDEKVRENAREHVTDTARRAHKGLGWNNAWRMLRQLWYAKFCFGPSPVSPIPLQAH